MVVVNKSVKRSFRLVSNALIIGVIASALVACSGSSRVRKPADWFQYQTNLIYSLYGQRVLAHLRPSIFTL